MNKRCFKVVMNRYGSLVSLLATGEAQVKYTPGKPAVPPEFLRKQGYGLAVFTSLEHVLDFLVLAESHAELWECFCAEITDKLPRPLKLTALSSGELRPGGNCWAEGVKMASQVILTRKIGVAESMFYIPVTRILREWQIFEEWQGVGKNKGLVFAPTLGIVTPPDGKLFFGYPEYYNAARVSSFALKVMGHGVLLKTVAPVILGAGEVAARWVGVIKLEVVE